MLRVVVGHSNDPDSRGAIAEILEQCHSSLAGEHPKAGILLAAIDFDHPLILQHIDQTYPHIQLIGGTTDGEISSVLGFEQDSLVLMLFCADAIAFRAGVGQNISQNATAAIQSAIDFATRNWERDRVKLCITLPESLTTSAASIVNNLQRVLGEQVPIFGGLTADGWRFKQTYQFCGTQVYSDAIPILLLAGSLHFSHGVASGWSPIGKRGKITKVCQNIVYEIDNQPALIYYQRYLGNQPPSSEYPLAVFDASEPDSYMRAPSGNYDPISGSITFFGDIPEQASVQITEATRDSILAASQTSTIEAIQNYPGTMPAAALFFSCASRRQILGSRTKNEYQLARGCIAQCLPSCGFYTNGEIAPLKQRGASYFHNETFITLLLGEA
ncbi:MAG: FIST N-terminal domain-containing protein [Cyanobacteriota bacterium]|nr:FIST N-terminal domain-containing protein [Cyanobacteriota bacterium]